MEISSDNGGVSQPGIPIIDLDVNGL